MKGPDGYSEEDWLALSGIQHFSFCKRQWALIHIEQLWSENYLTTAGHLEHERAHDYAASESRGDMLIMRDLRVYSRALGITGACDVVEFINCACDTSDRSSKSYKRFAKDVKERLIECMFGGAQFPMSILNAACHKVTRPMGYDNIRVWRRDFEIACSLWKKHYIDETRKQHRQEDVITMYLEPNRDDRDYLYGRLLALADNST